MVSGSARIDSKATDPAPLPKHLSGAFSGLKPLTKKLWLNLLFYKCRLCCIGIFRHLILPLNVPTVVALLKRIARGINICMHTFLRKGMALYIGASTWATFMDIDWRSEQRILFYMLPLKMTLDVGAPLSPPLYAPFHLVISELLSQ